MGGGDGSGVEGREGEGRVPDCLGGLSRVGISSRSTRPWNGQPPSRYYIYGCNLITIGSAPLNSGDSSKIFE